MQFHNALKPVFICSALAALAACSSDLTGTNKQPVKFSFTTNATVAPAAVGIRGVGDVAVGAGGNLVLSKVQLVVDKIELDRTGAGTCVSEIEAAGNDHAAIGPECEDVSRDPILVDLPIDNALHVALDIPLSAGTYSQLEAKIEPASDHATAFNAANSALVGKSVVVTGTYNGVAFTFTSSVRAGLEMSFSPPLVIDATTKNTSISVDVSKWFLDSSNAVIDPNSATPGSVNLQTIEDNIRKSFHAFEDDAESGVDDHSGHTG